MPQRTPSCQLDASPTPDSRGISPHAGDTQCPQHTLIRDTASQHIDHTASRHTGPRNWRRAITWLISAGIHPKTNHTTQRIADDLADRMDYSTGHVRYCLDEIIARTGISRATVKRHVGYLRELGGLAWVQHGTRHNIRRALGLKGYAATATVYAAVIPPAYDHAMGHTIIGTGYTARIVIDQRGQQKPTIPAQSRREPVDNSPVENPAFNSHEPPSLTWVKRVGQVQVVGGKDSSTEQARTADSNLSRRKKLKLTVTGYKITPDRVEKARQLAVSVRPLVNWIQGATHKQLSWVLLDMVARGWNENRILIWLNQLGQEIGAPRWRPRFPHRVIAAALLRKDKADKERTDSQGSDFDQAVRQAVLPHEAFAVAAQKVAAAHREPVVDYPDITEIPELSEERGLLRDKAKEDMRLLRLYMQLRGRDDAIRVYGLAAVAAMDAADEMAAAGLRSVTA